MAVLQAAFEQHRGRLDPPSGVHGETVESLRQKLKAGAAVLALVNDEVAGCVFYQQETSHVYLGRLSVLPEYRRHGVGRALVEYVERRALELNVPRVRLGVRLPLAEIRAYYERLGYRPIRCAAHEGYSGPTYVIMEKELSMEVKLSARDARLLRASFAAALDARAAGNHPFGAILADGEGNVLLTAGNTVVTERDVTGHAELNLVRLASRQFDRDTLAACTVYASTEPCAMCSAAIYWGNIGRVVYGLSQERFYGIRGQQGSSPLPLACRDVLSRGARVIEVNGPALEDDALEVHKGFWA